jgi:signal transduction histidine kinase
VRESPVDPELVAQLAHELRSPLNGIKGWVSVLQRALEDADPIAWRALDGILLGIEQQVALIEALEQLAESPESGAAARLREMLAQANARKRTVPATQD